MLWGVKSNEGENNISSNLGLQNTWANLFTPIKIIQI